MNTLMFVKSICLWCTKLQAGGVGRIAGLQQWKEAQYVSRSCTAGRNKQPGYIAGITSLSDSNGREKQGKIGVGDIPHSIRGDLSRLCRKGCLDEAVLILDAMDHWQGISGNADIYSSLLQGCAKTLGHWEKSSLTHDGE